MKKITVVSPVYNEEQTINVFYDHLKKTLESLPVEYEIILVNDGSKDNSLVVMLQLAEQDKRLKIINLSKNFGHQIAISAGLDHAYGDAVVILDSDMQDPPEVIKELYAKWKEGYEIINARRRSRKGDSIFKNLSAGFFYKFLNSLLTNKIPENVGDYRLMDKKAINILRKIKEKDRYLRGLSTWIGFKQGFVEFDRSKRYAGKTNYTFKKMLGLAFNAIFSFSSIPMKLASIIAIILLIVGLFSIIWSVVVALAGHAVPGWTSQVILITLYSALQMSILAIISEYVGRIYIQVQNRPLYIISEVYNFEKKKP